MSSFPYGKSDVCRWVRETFSPDASVLDVGACDGAWRRLLPEYVMDAVEIFGRNLPKLKGYRKVFHADVRELKYGFYDLIIFGDVLEHMSPEEAQAVLAYAEPRCRDLIIAVPFLYVQGEIYGNPWEIHVQDDLTPEIFAARYPGYEVLCDPGHAYCYYHKGA